jgi:hypothetical protein
MISSFMVSSLTRQLYCSYFDASGNDLSGSIPSNFLALPRLVDNVIYIILENNEISGTIPESLDPLTKLNINLVSCVRLLLVEFLLLHPHKA